MNTLLSPQDIFGPASDEPVVQSLLDIDFYKFTMGQFICSDPRWAETSVTFSLIVRSKGINLAEVIPEGLLREHLDTVRALRLSPAELSYLRGLPLGEGRLFAYTYICFLETLRLPVYELSVEDGNYRLTFSGRWDQVTYWETIAMSIISELYYWGLIKAHKVRPYEFAMMYAGMLHQLQQTAKMIRDTPGLTFSDFGTRRRHSRKYQSYTLGYLTENLPGQFVGTSNVLLAMQQGSNNPIGTNAHELVMVAANLTAGDTDEEIRRSQYEVVARWLAMYPQLSIILPDTFGTTQFLRNAPSIFAQKCVGVRLDSKDPSEATEEVIGWWESHDVDPQTKILIPSDGLTPQKMVELYRQHGHKVGKYTFGIGTCLTNSCSGFWPRQDDPGFMPFSMVVKVTEANGLPAVKLSDNPEKAMGGERAERFKRIFGTEGCAQRQLVV